MSQRFFGGPSGIALHALLLLHAVGAATYWLIQPRGFAFGRAFIEHEVIVPTVFVLAAAALLEPSRPRPMLVATGASAGFVAGVSLGFAMTGDSRFARALIVFGVVALAILFLVGRRARRVGLTRAGLHGGAVAGALLGAAFIGCTWAPPSSTRPSDRLARSAPAPAAVTDEGYHVKVIGPAVMVEDLRRGLKGHRALIFPALDFPVASAKGTWTLWSYGPVSLPDWSVERGEGNSLRLRAASRDLEGEGTVWVASGRVHIRCATTVKRDIAAHLTSAVRVGLPLGDIAVDGTPWKSGHGSAGPVEFLAFRNGRLEFLRASDAEKGPFTVMRAWHPRDPVFASDEFKVQVLGWAEQASREESPTAGWGVSQGAIERLGSEIIWSLASTSIGLGWHSVRTGTGTYVLEIILSR